MSNLQDNAANAVKVKYGYGNDQNFNRYGQDCPYYDPAVNRAEYAIDNQNFMERQAKARGNR